MASTFRYYIFTQSGEFLYFDATTNASRSGSGSITSFPVSKGFEATDNYVVEGQEITLTGVISDIKGSSSENLAARAFVDRIHKLRKDKELVDVYSGSITSVTNITEDCFLTNYTISQDVKHGITGPQENASYRISLTFKEIRSADVAQGTLDVTLQPEVEDTVVQKKEKDVTTKEREDDGRKLGILGWDGGAL